MRKKEVNKKESCLRKGRCLYLCVLLRFGNTLGIMPVSGPLSGEHPPYRNLPPTTFFLWVGLGVGAMVKIPKWVVKWIKSILKSQYF